MRDPEMDGDRIVSHICDVLCPGCGEYTYCVSCDLCEECDYEEEPL